VTTEATAELRRSEKSLEKVLLAGHNHPDRLPGLQLIFSQLPRVMVEEIGHLSHVPLKIRLLELSASTFGETCTLPPNTLAGVVRAERWRSWVYFISDPLATALFVDAATGCEGFSSGRLAARRPTKTDANLLRVLFRRLARSLAAAFSLLVDISFDVGSVVEKIEMEPQLTTASPVIVARLSLEYSGQAGVLTIVIPQAALESIREVLAAATPGEPLAAAGSRYRDDSEWSKQLAEEISRAFINLNGILEERTIPLGEVKRFAVGSVVELTGTSLSRVRLDADEKPLFWCELGKRDGALILRVADDFDQSREAIDEFYGL
jgi:flagellar motor switch protein FliM